MQKLLVSILAFLLFQLVTYAQSNEKRALQLDVQHYSFNIQVNDESDRLTGEAILTIRFLNNLQEFYIDLTGINSTGKGMKVSAVFQDDRPAKYAHNADMLVIYTTALSGETKKFTIRYEGIPADGLIFSKNKYNQRTMFADNWPNRAHNWIPCIDHPSDKASVEFIVTAPEHYQVVSNGIEAEQTNLANNLKKTHWVETVPLPTKVMVIGLAGFAVNYAGDVDCIPVSNWVYPQDSMKGFYDYAQALEILPWFIKNVGPYPYRKLANVQSKTKFGGMENASAIFYFENSVTGDRTIEPLLAHEIAHQWFGNSVTEKNWFHVWLSEGFATYLTHMYLENKYGKETISKRLKEDREEVIKYFKKKTVALVDTTPLGNYMQLLNVNSYQKGGWVLHMLRNELGDSMFMAGLRKYYSTYTGKNASSEDFMKIMESVSGKNLQPFFQQWVNRPGQPELKLFWTFDDSKHALNITIVQKQPTVFIFPLDILIHTGKGNARETLRIKDKTTSVKIPLLTKPGKIKLDPDTKLLYSVSE